MNVFKFYQLDYCIRNLGIAVIAIASLGSMPNMFYVGLILFQLLLIQMNSFSMNNYFDYKAWKEKNYIGKLLKSGFNECLLIFLTLVPLVVMIFTIPFSNSYIWILLAYIILFFLYQAQPFRLKNNWFASIILNSLCLGLILYIYPYLFLADGLTLTAIIFSIIFFFYLSFHEVVHQIAHIGRDKIHSLPDAIGIRKSVNVAEMFLFIPIFAAIVALIINPIKYIFFTGTVIFCFLRLYKLYKIEPKKEEFNKIRNRTDKFYSFQEAIYYLIFLGLLYFVR